MVHLSPVLRLGSLLAFLLQTSAFQSLGLPHSPAVTRSVRSRVSMNVEWAAWWALRPGAARKVEVGAPDPAADDLHRLLLARRTINAFEPTLPSGWEDALERAVEAATYAPNHRLTEPWRFHLLGPSAVRRVCELNADLATASNGAEAGAKKLKRWLEMPGWLVITCVQQGDARAAAASMAEDPGGVAREDYAACCCAVQNICLSLHASGLGTKWTTGAVNFDPRFASAANLPPDQFVVGTLWFGTPTSVPSPPRKKLLMAEVLCKHD